MIVVGNGDDAHQECSGKQHKKAFSPVRAEGLNIDTMLISVLCSEGSSDQQEPGQQQDCVDYRSLQQEPDSSGQQLQEPYCVD